MEQEKRHQKLKIKEILEDLRETDVKAFIMSYSKKDKSFELAFKSHFLSRIVLGDEGTKYRRILSEIIKPKSTTSNKIGMTQKKTILIILDDFVLQMRDCLSTENYTEAYYIVKESLSKIIYLQTRYEVTDLALEKNRIHFLKGLNIILEQDLAPVFRANAEKEMIRIVKKSYYRPAQENLILSLNRYNAITEDEKHILIDELYNKSKHDTDIINILSTSIQLSYPHVDIAKDILQKYDHNKIFVALRNIIADGQIELADFYVKTKEINFSFQKVCLICFKLITEKNYTILNKQLVKLDRKEIDYQVFYELMEALPDRYLIDHFDAIQNWVDTLPFIMMTKIYARAQRYQMLLHLLADKNQINYLQSYDALLIEKGYQREIKELYLILTESYLNEHLGQKTTDFLLTIKQHLYKISQSDIVYAISDNISKKYAHRKSIKNNMD